MSGIIQFGLARLAARRVASWPTILWITAVLAVAVATRGEAGSHFGLARQHVWAAFLLLIAPPLLLRATQRAAPQAARDAAWLATRSASNASIALSTWFGVLAPWCIATCAFALCAEAGAPAEQERLVAAGSCELPSGGWSSSGSPLAWKITLDPAAEIERVTFAVGIGSTVGSATCVETRWRNGTEWRNRTSTWIGSRGEVAVDVRRGDTATIEVELLCEEPGTRAVVLSPTGTLWKRSDSRHAAGAHIALRLGLAGASWLALALLLACCAGATTAACSVVFAWIPVWMGDWPNAVTRWIPGADLFDALAIVGTGRAPGAPLPHAWIGALLVVAVGLAATALALRHWRVSR